MLGIVVSEADEASVHIGEQLRALADWTERSDSSQPAAAGGGRYWMTEGAALRSIEGLHLDTTDVAAVFDQVSLVVFVSRHSGETGRLLSAHFTGNLGAPKYGGEPGTLAEAAPGAGGEVLTALSGVAPSAYDVTMECTHHGPSKVGAPSLFVELGSDEEAWRDPAGAEAVAAAVLALRDVEHSSGRNVVCIGGDHYASRATRIARETDWHVGHIAAEWALEQIGQPADDVLEQLFEQSGATLAVIEGEYPDIRATVEQLGYRVVSETWLRETRGIPQERAEALEAQLSSVEEGLRFGEQARLATAWTIRELPSGLLKQCQGDDAEETESALAANTVAYETADGGSRIGDRAAVQADADLQRLVERLTEVLREHHDAVRRHEGEIVVSDSVFDAEAARELDVPEGPLFGQLAEGQPVTVDGRTVNPNEVRRERTRRFEV